jgi:hypothetical protein
MGYLDWIFKYKFESEKQTLIDLRKHTIGWYNQVAEPVMPILLEIKFDQPFTEPEKYSEIAMKIFEMQVTSNEGEELENILASMSPRGVPLFTSRRNLSDLAARFQRRGLFIKELAVGLHKWKGMPLDYREQTRKNIFEGWKKFEEAKDDLVNEINQQIKGLG